MREEDFVQGISMNYAQQERDLANDHTLSQPERNRIPWIIGVLVTIGVIIVVAWIIATTVASAGTGPTSTPSLEPMATTFSARYRKSSLILHNV